jgi:hypothetical protein
VTHLFGGGAARERAAGDAASAGRARERFDAACARLRADAARVHGGMEGGMAARHRSFAAQLRRRAAELNRQAEEARRREWAAGDLAQSESRALLHRSRRPAAAAAARATRADFPSHWPPGRPPPQLIGRSERWPPSLAISDDSEPPAGRGRLG